MTKEQTAIIKSLLDTAAELEAALDTPRANDMIFAWSNGLGVKLVGVDPKPVVVGVLHASRLTYGRRLVFTNGQGEKAEWMLRSKALKNAIQGLLDVVADAQRIIKENEATAAQA